MSKPFMRLTAKSSERHTGAVDLSLDYHNQAQLAKEIIESAAELSFLSPASFSEESLRGILLKKTTDPRALSPQNASYTLTSYNDTQRKQATLEFQDSGEFPHQTAKATSLGVWELSSNGKFTAYIDTNNLVALLDQRLDPRINLEPFMDQIVPQNETHRILRDQMATIALRDQARQSYVVSEPNFDGLLTPYSSQTSATSELQTSTTKSRRLLKNGEFSRDAIEKNFRLSISADYEIPTGDIVTQTYQFDVRHIPRKTNPLTEVVTARSLFSSTKNVPFERLKQYAYADQDDRSPIESLERALAIVCDHHGNP